MLSALSLMVPSACRPLEEARGLRVTDQRRTPAEAGEQRPSASSPGSRRVAASAAE
ncbi:MAG: hypothetical protein R3F65_25240 [bacterium]